MSVFFDSWIPPQGYHAALRCGQAPYLTATVTQVRYRSGRFAAFLRWIGWVGSDFGHTEDIIWRSDPVDCKTDYQQAMRNAEQIASRLSSIDPKGEKDSSWAKKMAAEEVRAFVD